MSKNTGWILHCDTPALHTRTGHCAISNRTLLFYFSFYQNLEPSIVRKKSFFEKLEKIVTCTVDSHEKDTIMRGQSRDRKERNENEDISVSELMATLPSNPAQRSVFQQKGQYRFAIQLPDTLDSNAIIEELQTIKNAASFVMFPGLSQMIYQDPNLHNCCSSIWSALQKGGINANNSIIPELPTSLKLISWALYFLFLSYSSSAQVSSEHPGRIIFYAPLVYFITQLLQSLKNAYEYASDLIGMAKENQLSPYTLYFVYATCMIINLLATPMSTDGCANLFIFPENLKRKVMAIPGIAISVDAHAPIPTQ